MRPLWGIVLLAAVVSIADGSGVEERFSSAGQAYDEGRYEEAVAAYEELLGDGLRAPELYYNLGNAYYRTGDMGRAMLNYQSARYLAPRDRVVRHNIAFVRNQTDAVYPSVSTPVRWLRTVSLSEWVVVAALAWWLTLFYASLLLWPGWRRGWRFSALSCAAVLLVALAGIFQWVGFRFRPEGVILAGDQEALFAPLDHSTAHFSLPEGSITRIDTKDTNDKGWYRVVLDGRIGWVRRDAVHPVEPWRSIPSGE